MGCKKKTEKPWYEDLFTEINIEHVCAECKRTIKTSATIGPAKAEYTRTYWCNNDLCGAPHKMDYKCTKLGEMRIKRVACRGKRVDKELTIKQS